MPAQYGIVLTFRMTKHLKRGCRTIAERWDLLVNKSNKINILEK